MGGNQSKSDPRQTVLVTGQAQPEEGIAGSSSPEHLFKKAKRVIIEGNREFQLGKWERAEASYLEGLAFMICLFNIDKEGYPVSPRIEELTVRKVAKFAGQIIEYLQSISAAESMGTLTQEESKIGGCQGKDIALFVSDFLNNLGAVKYVKKEFKSSLALHQKALELRILLKGDVSYEVAESYQNLSSVNDALEQFNEAESQLRNAIDIEIKCHAEDSIEASSMFNNLAVLYTHMGRLGEAERVLKSVVSRRLLIFGPTHRLTKNAKGNLEIVMDQAARRCVESFNDKGMVKEEATASAAIPPSLSTTTGEGKEEAEELMTPKRREKLSPFPPAMLDDVESPDLVASKDSSPSNSQGKRSYNGDEEEREDGNGSKYDYERGDAREARERREATVQQQVVGLTSLLRVLFRHQIDHLVRYAEVPGPQHVAACAWWVSARARQRGVRSTLRT